MLVRAADEHAARAALAKPPEAETDNAAADRPCPHCHERMPDSWECCWRCGRPTDGQADDGGAMRTDIHEQERREPPTAAAAAWFVALAVLASLAVAGGVNWVWIVMLAGLLVMLVCLGPREGETQEDATCEPDSIREAREAEPRNWPVQRIEAAARRAWQSAMLGLHFPPLAVYSLYLLGRIHDLSAPRSLRTKRYLLGTWILMPIGVALFLFLGLLVFGALGSVFFDFTGVGR